MSSNLSIHHDLGTLKFNAIVVEHLLVALQVKDASKVRMFSTEQAIKVRSSKQLLKRWSHIYMKYGRDGRHVIIIYVV